MPDSIAQQIVDALTTTVGALAIIKQSGNRNVHWTDVEETPAAFIVYAGELKTPEPTVRKTSSLNVAIQTLHHADDPDREFMAVIKAIEDAIEADPSIGGLSDNAWVSSTSPLLTSEEIAEEGFFIGDIIVTVQYRYARAAA